MTDYTAAEVEAMLTRHGLSGDSFDAEEIAGDLTARTELNDGLDALLDELPRAVPTAFEPAWDRK